MLWFLDWAQEFGVNEITCIEYYDTLRGVYQLTRDDDVLYITITDAELMQYKSTLELRQLVIDKITKEIACGHLDG